MQVSIPDGTAEPGDDARQIRRRTSATVDELNRLEEEIEEAIYYFRWLRFLDYDPRSIEFLEKLDMPRGRGIS